MTTNEKKTKKASNPQSSEELDKLALAIASSPANLKAYEDKEFLGSSDARALRILSEYLKAETAFTHQNVHSTIIVFGSARIPSPETAAEQMALAQKELKEQPDSRRAAGAVAKAQEQLEMSHYYELTCEFAKIVSEHNQFYEANSSPSHHPLYFVICTGGGPGIMEAANRGAYEAGGISIGLNISLPFEQMPNPYITPELCFQYHYFAMRKLHFMMRAKALVAFPGGFGTLDELFEGLTLRQTGRMQELPIVMFGEKFWKKLVNWDYLVTTGMISADDLKLFHFVETAKDAWDCIRNFYVKKG